MASVSEDQLEQLELELDTGPDFRLHRDPYSEYQTNYSLFS